RPAIIRSTLVLPQPDTPQQRDIAMAFQQHALYPHLTVEQNMGFALKVSGVHRREIARRVGALATALGLSDVLDRRPAHISGGQQQRVAMARAIIRDPRLFLMDEPLSNLDAKLRTEARATIMSIHRRLRSTTVYVTHDQLEAMSMADRVLVMRSGVVVQRGAPMDVYRAPVDLFVGSFFGSPPMSAVLGRFESTGSGATLLRFGSHALPIPADAFLTAQGRRLDSMELVVGIRPEAIHVDPDGPLELSVDSVEQLGHEWLVRLVVDAPAIQVSEDGGTLGVAEHPFSTVAMLLRADRPPSLWEPIRADVDVTGVHLFDLADGRALAHGVVDARRSA
ncbi:MAG: ABC transporter ATP-binding protein, partial [Actinomycetota bacterium]